MPLVVTNVLAWIGAPVLAAVGLGVSKFDNADGIIHVSVVSGMGFKHEFGTPCLYEFECSGMAMAHGHGEGLETGETVYHKGCIYTACGTAIALQSIHLF